MRALVCCFLLAAGMAAAQQVTPPLVIRSVSVRLIPSSSQGMNAIGFDRIAAALKRQGIPLAVEGKFDAAVVEKASDVIRDLYLEQGQKVSVEHSVAQLPPRSVEVRFEVVQLCNCD